jgi:hypothetical protein
MPLESFLHTAGPGLATLLSLELHGLRLQHFPEILANTLWRVEALSLVGSNFMKMPAALSRITTLRSLNLHGNIKLRLDASDRDTLAALTDLKELKLPSNYMEKGGWTELNWFPHLSVS